MRLLLLCLALGGCGTVTGAPNALSGAGEISCQGKAVLSMIGATGPVAGVNGSITTDCGSGATLRWGPSTAAPLYQP